MTFQIKVINSIWNGLVYVSKEWLKCLKVNLESNRADVGRLMLMGKHNIS
jgi:hypothetical protein